MVVEVKKLLAVEGEKSLEDAVSDPAGADGADDLAFDVVRVACDLGDVPAASFDLLVSRREVADEGENRPALRLRLVLVPACLMRCYSNDYMLGDARNVRAVFRRQQDIQEHAEGRHEPRNFNNSDFAFIRGVQVDMVRPDAGGDADLEVLGLVDDLTRSVAGVEGSAAYRMSCEAGGEIKDDERDQDFRIDDVLLELRIRAFLIVSDL